MAPVLESRNPLNGELVGSVELTPVEEISAIVERSRESGRPWARMSAEERGRALAPAGRRLGERAEELGAMITREMGKPKASAVREVAGCGRRFERAIEEIVAALAPETVEDRHTRSMLHYDPLGVAAAITPWNFPVSMAQWLLLPALVAGNTVVFKPSEETPLVGQAYADILGECLPSGVLEVVHGDERQGKGLVAADVDLIAFTGSREAGKHILASASARLKRVVLELGGKAPLIVLPDADVEAAARFAVVSCFDNAGQMCISTERIYVAAGLAGRFVGRLAELAAGLRTGNGLEDDTDVGPMVNSNARDRVLGQIESAISSGARLVAGGDHPPGFVRPTVLADVTDDMEIMSDETFGPVACIREFDEIDDAVNAANGGRFGLGAVVFGGDEEGARQVARRLEAGMIGVNKPCFGASGAPWVGARESGFGFHSSVAGHRQFAQVRVVSASL